MTEPRADLPTHLVENQPAARVPRLWDDDLPLRGAFAGQSAAAAVRGFAETLSDPAMLAAGRDAYRHPPELRLFDAGVQGIIGVRASLQHYSLRALFLCCGAFDVCAFVCLLHLPACLLACLCASLPSSVSTTCHRFAFVIRQNHMTALPVSPTVSKRLERAAVAREHGGGTLQH